MFLAEKFLSIFRGERNSSLKICLISNEYPSEDCGGGIGTYTYRLAGYLGRMGHRVWVICRGRSERDSDVVICDGNVIVYSIKNKRIRLPILAKFFKLSYDRLSRSLAVYDKLKEILSKEKIDIIETPSWCAEGLFCLRLRDIPVVVKFCTSMADLVELGIVRSNLDVRITCRLEKILSQRAAKCIAPTQAVKDECTDRLNLARDKIAMIHHGTEIPDNDIYNFQPGLILFVGKLDVRKGIEYLLKAIPAVLMAIPQAEFVLIGEDVGYRLDGLSIAEYIEKRYAPEIKPRVRKLGFLTHEIIKAYYRKCDIFVAPSIYESFGLVFIEAMSYGKPVVAFDVAGTGEIIKDKHTGLLVRVGDVRGLVQAMVYLLNNRNFRNEMAGNCRVWVEKNFSARKMAEKTLALYKNLI